MEKKFQIFISSTFEDLKDERREVISAVLGLSHVPVGMELFSAGNDQQWTLIKDCIRESDYFLSIVAQRYGSQIQGKSYTEREYDYAIEQGVPVAGFILSRDAAEAWPMSRCEPESKDQLKLFKEKLQTRVCQYWSSPESLKYSCATSIIDLIKRNPRDGWIPARQAARPEVANELARLSQENEALRKQLGEVESVDPRLVSILRSTSIIPCRYGSNEVETELTLLDCFRIVAPVAIQGETSPTQVEIEISHEIQAGARSQDLPAESTVKGDLVPILTGWGLLSTKSQNVASRRPDGLPMSYDLVQITDLGRQLYLELLTADRTPEETL